MILTRTHRFFTMIAVTGIAASAVFLLFMVIKFEPASVGRTTTGNAVLVLTAVVGGMIFPMIVLCREVFGRKWFHIPICTQLGSVAGSAAYALMGVGYKLGLTEFVISTVSFVALLALMLFIGAVIGSFLDEKVKEMGTS